MNDRHVDVRDSYVRRAFFRNRNKRGCAGDQHQHKQHNDSAVPVDSGFDQTSHISAAFC